MSETKREEAEVGVMDCETGGRSHEPRNARGPLKAGKCKRTDCPLKPPKGTGLC